MISHLDLLLALHAKALALEVLAVTASISATATGYARSSGSFLTDGFEAGQEVHGTSFTNSENNEAKVVTNVTALALTTEGLTVAADGRRTRSGTSGTTVEAEATRTLTVGLPADVEYENATLTPGVGVPWWREEYSPGPGRRIGPGQGAELEYFVDYFVTLFLPPLFGARAARRYADELLAHFPPGLLLTSAPTPARVRGDVVPFVGKFLQSQEPEGYLVVPVTVPLIVRTANSI